jgi:hypothetical protein
MNVKANRVADFDHCKNPGDFFLTPAADGRRRLSFMCPCGCGVIAGIVVRIDGQHDTPAWGWNLDEDLPTTTPSIDIKEIDSEGKHVGSHWHGYLTKGEFVPC